MRAMTTHLSKSYAVRLLATAATLDPRSARKALQLGPETLRGAAGVRARLAMDRLGLSRWEDLGPIDPPLSAA